jgi:hypothetical protein
LLSRILPATIELRTGVRGDLAGRSLQRATHDVDAGGLVGIGAGRLDGGRSAQQGDAAAGNDAFLDGRAGRVQRVVDAVLLLLDLDLGRAADADDGDAASQLGQTLLQLLAVVVRGGLLDLLLDLGDAALDLGLLAGAVDDRGVLLLDAHLLGAAEHVEVTFSSLMPRSSEITWPPVRIAMSSSMALRRSPKPGALTAAIFRPPRSLLTTSVARASPSTSSAMMSSGLEVCTTASRTGSMACRLESFFSWSRM